MEGETPAPSASGLSTAHQMVGLGALLVVADYILFELLLDTYGFFTGTLLVAVFAAYLVWAEQQRPGRWPVPTAWLLKILGAAAGVLGLVELLTDLRLGVLDNATDIIAGLALYAGAALMFLGARRLES